MSVRRKVLVVIGQLEVGGAERHLLHVLPKLRLDVLDVTVYAMRSGGALESEFSAAGIRTISPAHHSRRWIGLLRTAIHLTRTARELRPDVVHYFLPEAYLLGGLCSMFWPPCIHLMSRRSLNKYQRKRPFVRQIEGFLHSRMDGILANSKAVWHELGDEGVESKQRAIIYNGVGYGASTASRIETRQALDLAENVLVFVMVANFIPYKGHKDLISALAIARDELPHEWKLLLIGRDSGIEEELRTAACRANIDSHIRWLGAKRNPVPYLLAADVALLTSYEEGFSNAILEAMSVGLPLLVTDVGGNREAVVNDVTGIVVPPNAPEDLARAILRIAHNPQLREEMANAGRDRVEKHFSLDECARSYENLYLRIESSRSTPLQELIAS
ncbi:MAG: glycosyltransferase [Gammaproteobacteria bacterium]